MWEVAGSGQHKKLALVCPPGQVTLAGGRRRKRERELCLGATSLARNQRHLCANRRCFFFHGRPEAAYPPAAARKREEKVVGGRLRRRCRKTPRKWATRRWRWCCWRSRRSCRPQRRAFWASPDVWKEEQKSFFCARASQFYVGCQPFKVGTPGGAKGPKVAHHLRDIIRCVARPTIYAYCMHN